MSTLREMKYMVNSIEEDVASSKAELRAISRKMDRIIALLGSTGQDKPSHD